MASGLYPDLKREAVGGRPERRDLRGDDRGFPVATDRDRPGPPPRRTGAIPSSSLEPNMMFARRSHGLIPMSRSSRRGRRPSRARGPGLVVEGCEGRMLLSTALVTLDAAGTAAGNSVSDFDTTTTRRPQLGEPVAVAPGQPQRRRDEAGLRQRGDRPGRRPRRHQPRQRRLRPRPGDRPDDAGQRDSLRPGRQRGLVRSRDQPQRPVRRVPQRRHQPVHGPRRAGRRRGRYHRRRQPDGSIPLRPRPGDRHRPR